MCGFHVAESSDQVPSPRQIIAVEARITSLSREVGIGGEGRSRYLVPRSRVAIPFACRCIPALYSA